MLPLPRAALILLLVAVPLRWHRYKDRKISKIRTYRKRRAFLFKKLGGKCKKCGEDEDLTIDHVDGCTWEQRSMNKFDRWRRYYYEYTGEDPKVPKVRLRLLCRGCNGRWDPWKKKWQ